MKEALHPMIVDAGTLRFVLPDRVRDSSLYVFRRADEQVSMSIEPLHASLDPRAMLQRVLRPIERYLGHPPTYEEFDDVASTSSTRRIAEMDLSELGCFSGYVFDRLDSATGLCVRYAGPSNPPHDTHFFREVARAIAAPGSARASLTQGWMPLVVYGFSFSVPREFIPTIAYAYSTPEWTITINRKPPGEDWRPYFLASDDVRVLRRDSKPATYGPGRLPMREMILQVARHRPAIGNAGLVIAEAINDEHVVHEAVVPYLDAAVRIAGAASMAHTKEFDDAWEVLLGSIVMRPQ